MQVNAGLAERSATSDSLHESKLIAPAPDWHVARRALTHFGYPVAASAASIMRWIAFLQRSSGLLPY
jgi:hypothetical protein